VVRSLAPHENLTIGPADVIELERCHFSGPQAESGQQEQIGMVSLTDGGP
jgi:hypothetical protein